jgi:hypothetical protein
MCGLVGIVVKSQNGFCSGERDAFDELLYMDALRGMDSTGVTAFYNNGDAEILKTAMDAYGLKWYNEYGAKEYGDILTRTFKDGKALLGHNRKGTVGKITEENAHPFVVQDRWMFMHNGTLRNHRKLGDFDVDSEALANALCPIAHDKEKLEALLAQVEGAYACQWIDQEKEVLYLLRNKERPLFLAETSIGYLWASEPMMVYAAASRNRIKIDKIEEIKEHTLVSIDLDSYTLIKKEEPLTIKKALPQYTTTGGNTGGNRHSFRGKGKISKNAFKKLQEELLGERTRFYMDDYLESNYPAVDGNYMIWGTNGGFLSAVPHKIMSTLSGISETEIKYAYSNNMLEGRIVEMDYNKSELEIVLKVEDVQVALTH